jgi:multicomponent Na+:H+ antiporter subunit D
MTESLLPGVLIALPLIGATLPVAVGLVRERVGWSIAAVVLTVETVLASWLAYAVYADGRRIVHVLGGASFGRKTTEVGGSSTEGFIVGIELVADNLSALLVVLVGAVALAVLAAPAETRSTAAISCWPAV